MDSNVAATTKTKRQRCAGTGAAVVGEEYTLTECAFLVFLFHNFSVNPSFIRHSNCTTDEVDAEVCSFSLTSCAPPN